MIASRPKAALRVPAKTLDLLRCIGMGNNFVAAVFQTKAPQAVRCCSQEPAVLIGNGVEDAADCRVCNIVKEKRMIRLARKFEQISTIRVKIEIFVPNRAQEDVAAPDKQPFPLIVKRHFTAARLTPDRTSTNLHRIVSDSQ